MRLFVAVDPPPVAVEHLRRHLEPTPSGLRWADPTQWHLTLTFCGEVDERKVGGLSERLARAAARSGPFEMQLVGAGAFSRPVRAHALWIGLAGETAQLDRLAASTTAAARRCGIPVEDRRFRAHLTVARASPPRDLRELVHELSSYKGPPWTVEQLHLVRSNLGPPTVHERVESWALGPR